MAKPTTTQSSQKVTIFPFFCPVAISILLNSIDILLMSIH
jgi:hypothetical protein